MRVTRPLSLGLLFISIILLVIYQPFNYVLAANQQNILTVWGFFPKEYLESIITNYHELHPNTKIIYSEQNFNLIAEAFKERANQGLGPDAVILSEREIPELIKLKLIEKLDADQLDTTNWHPKSLIPLQMDGSLYGIPIAFQTMALCYNRNLTKTPATTLDELLEQTNDGVRIGIETEFLKSMWGIGLFGGQLFNSSNQFVLQPESLIKWLSWLKETENNPATYFDSRSEFLYDLFGNEQLAYLPCWNFEFRLLREKLQEKLGITYLPRTSTESESPYLEVDSLLVNVHANTKQKRLAEEFGNFITKLEQQIHIINEDGNLFITPINRNIKVDKKLFPILSVISNVAKSKAVPFPISENYSLKRIRYYGDLLFNQVLAGSVSPEEGVKQFFDRLENPPPDENIIVSNSVGSEKSGKLDDLSIKPDVNYLKNFLVIFWTTLKRPTVFREIVSVIVTIFTTWILARKINEWLKNLLG